jgi:two-component system sensor histidine kinase KdpD
LLTTCASLIALAIERDLSFVEAQQAQLNYQAEQLRTSLLSSVSHDLRTPLAAITGAASDLLRQASNSDGRQRELLEMIVQESRRLNRLVENLLNMTRLESGAANPQKQWHVLEEVVGSALRRLEPDLKRHQVTVTLPEDLPLVYLDDLLIEQVLINLLENALRYTPPGSRIEISAQQRERKVVLRITDNGPGVPSGWEEKIFDKFVRGQATIPDGSRGAGLGLAICRAIVESHGGTIIVHNLPSGGAEFIVSLPHDPAAVPPVITA